MGEETSGTAKNRRMDPSLEDDEIFIFVLKCIYIFVVDTKFCKIKKCVPKVDFEWNIISVKYSVFLKGRFEIYLCVCVHDCVCGKT